MSSFFNTVKRVYSTVPTLTHVNKYGQAHIVNIGNKNETLRVATATATIYIGKQIQHMIKENTIKKGDVLQVARIAGIQASKKCSELIPLCHPIMINSVSIDFSFPSEEEIQILSTVETTGKTGVEMEALLSANVSALTIYDMCKAVKKDMIVKDVLLLKKTGGKSGEYNYKPESNNINYNDTSGC